MKAEVKCICPCCGKDNFVNIDTDDLIKYAHGEYAQNAFPYLSPAQRELLITGMCEECWDKMCPEEE